MSFAPEPVIGLVSWDFERPKGGMGRTMQWMVATLRAHGATVCVGSPRAFSHPEEQMVPLTTRWGGHVLFSLALHAVLPAWIRRHHVETVLIPSGPGGVLLVRKPAARFTVVACHTYAQQARLVPGQWWKRIVFYPLERRMYRMADAILCFSHDTRRVLEGEYGVVPERIREVPHAIDVSRWQPASPTVREQGLCVCVARLEERKGVVRLLDAWREVEQMNPSARLVLVGNGVQHRKVAARMRGLSRAQWQTYLPEEQLIRLHQQAELVLCPAYLEGFGLACAQAMAAGCVPVIYDVDGLRGLIEHGKSGWVVRTSDRTSYARAIDHLLRDSQTLQHMSVQARAFIRERFDPAATNAQLAAACAARFA
jgi:glycosyltransferase involved in cell wall biosynthesis